MTRQALKERFFGLPTWAQMLNENDGKPVQRADYILLVLNSNVDYNDFAEWRKRELRTPDVNYGQYEIDGYCQTVWHFGSNHCPPENDLIEITWIYK